MLPIIEIGPLSLPTPALLLLLGFWIGSILVEKAALRFDLDPKLTDRLIWVGLAAGLLGARLSFLVRFPGAFQGDWLSIVSLNSAFLDPASGILLGLSAIVFIVLREGLNYRKLLDIALIFTLTIFVFLSLSRFAGGSGLGIATNLPWGIIAAGAVRHPVQLYYVLLGVAGLLLVFFYPPLLDLPPGGLAAALLSYLSGILLFFSRFQLPAMKPIAGFRSDQILYWLLLLLGLILYHQLVPGKSKELSDDPQR